MRAWTASTVATAVEEWWGVRRLRSVEIGRVGNYFAASIFAAAGRANECGARRAGGWVACLADDLVASLTDAGGATLFRAAESRKR